MQPRDSISEGAPHCWQPQGRWLWPPRMWHCTTWGGSSTAQGLRAARALPSPSALQLLPEAAVKCHRSQVGENQTNAEALWKPCQFSQDSSSIALSEVSVCFSFLSMQSWWGWSSNKLRCQSHSFLEGACGLLASLEPFSPRDLPLLSPQPFIACPPQGLPRSDNNTRSHELAKSRQEDRPHTHGSASTKSQSSHYPEEQDPEAPWSWDRKPVSSSCSLQTGCLHGLSAAHPDLPHTLTDAHAAYSVLRHPERRMFQWQHPFINLG